MLINKIEDALMHLSRYTLGKTFPDYCDLRTVIGLTADDKVRRLAGCPLYSGHPE
ncbi:hypothetical protein ACLBOM_36640 [Escherichia coli]